MEISTSSSSSLNNKETMFRSVLSEYLDAFGGANPNGFAPATKKSFQLAQEYTNIKDNEMCCFYMNNFLINKNLIQKSIASNTSKEQLNEIRCYEKINTLLLEEKFNKFFDIFFYINNDRNMERFMQKYYTKYKVIESGYRICPNENDAMQIEILNDYMGQRGTMNKRLLYK